MDSEVERVGGETGRDGGHINKLFELVGVEAGGPDASQGKFVFGQGAGFVGGDGSNDADTFDSTELFDEGFSSSHATSTEGEDDSDGDGEAFGDGRNNHSEG